MSDRKEYSVVGIPVVRDPQDGFAHTLKQGHSCCGGCCDMRRSVIIVNIISIVFCMLALAFVNLGYNIIGQADQISDALDDDDAKEAFSDAEQDLKGSLGFAIFILVAKMACFSCGIYGAVKYNIWLVGVSLAAYFVAFAMALYHGAVLLLLLPGFFAYPHVFFIKEVHQGIMSAENYELEKQSCCCV